MKIWIWIFVYFPSETAVSDHFEYLYAMYGVYGVSEWMREQFPHG